MKTITLLYTITSAALASSSLLGTWSSDCVSIGRHAAIATIHIHENSYQLFAKLYEAPGCAIHTARIEIDADYTLGKTIGAGRAMDHTPNRVEMQLKTAEVVNHYNTNKICNRNNWKLGVSQNIEGALACVGFNPPSAGTKYFDFMKMNEEHLLFSFAPSINFNERESKRPRSIPSRAISFWKVSKDSFNRVHRDLKIFDEYIKSKRQWFSKIPKKLESKKWVKKKLSFMVKIDQYMRSYTSLPHADRYSKEETQKFHELLFSKFSNVDGVNTNDLKEIIATHGWPKISEFGAQADSDAWLIVQHADNDLEFQKEMLSVLAELWKKAETNSRNYAYLHDRVAASWSDPSFRKLQRYGTQGMCVAPGKWKPINMEEPSRVDERRAQVGLPPLKDYIEGFQEICR